MKKCQIGMEGQRLGEILGCDLAGLSLEPLFTLGLQNLHFRPFDQEASEVVKRAYGWIYPGLHVPSYPHITCPAREPLVQILKMVEGWTVTEKIGDTTSDHHERVNHFVRETAGLLSEDRTRVMFIGGYDSRRAKENQDMYPRFVKVMPEEEYDLIVEADPLAFAAALGRMPRIPFWNHTR